MHIPDGLLSAPVALTSAGLSAVAVGAACARAPVGFSARRASTIGVTAAFVFAAQMINFPIAGGTSGHLVGGVLAAVLVGPSAAVVVMTAVLILQCLVFGDGGLLALGANVLNMAVLHPLVGFTVYRAVVGRAGPSGVRGIAGVAFGSWIATVVAAAACAGELTLSGISTPWVVLSAMAGVHAVIGLGEALIASLVVATVMRLRPELLRRVSSGAGATALTGVLLGLSSSLALALFVSPFACTWPDGLERVVAGLGIEPLRARLALHAPLGGYTVAGMHGSWLGTSIAALAGTSIVFVACLGIGLLLAPKAGRSPPSRVEASRS
ncbi:MAG TPA: energy-coupling factor ABC transporter permease [Polyangiaceae bacterium]|nr:energy-coupling factor ABC transporter permease [Polyangiaceae bacterium]